MGTAVKHPMPDRVKPSFVIFGIQAIWRCLMVSLTSQQQSTLSLLIHVVRLFLFCAVRSD